MDFQGLSPALRVRWGHEDVEVEASGAEEGRVEGPGPVGRGEEEDCAVVVAAIAAADACSCSASTTRALAPPFAIFSFFSFVFIVSSCRIFPALQSVDLGEEPAALPPKV